MLTQFNTFLARILFLFCHRRWTCAGSHIGANGNDNSGSSTTVTLAHSKNDVSRMNLCMTDSSQLDIYIYNAKRSRFTIGIVF